MIAALLKARIAFFFSLTGAAGYILYSGVWERGIWAPTVGLFLLAAGASALNQYQERDLDREMARTRDRPIPAGRISPLLALQVAIVLLLAGFWVLLLATPFTAVLLGLFALFWYNGVYVFLKRWTAFAVVPGSLLGAVAPLLGWVAAGGEMVAPPILVFAAFFFVWQIPHFWLLLLHYGKEYEAAGYPSLTAHFAPMQIARLVFVWTVATAFVGLLMPFFAAVQTPFVAFILVAFGVWVSGRTLRTIGRFGFQRASGTPDFKTAFIDINLYALGVMLAVVIDALIR